MGPLLRLLDTSSGMRLVPDRMLENGWVAERAWSSVIQWHTVAVRHP